MRHKSLATGLLLVLAATVLIGAAQTVSLVPIWTGRGYTFPRLGPGLIVQNGQLDILPTPALKTRRYNVQLAYDATAGAWILPAAAVNVVVFANGLRYMPDIDYTLATGQIRALAGAMLPEFLITADFDQ